MAKVTSQLVIFGAIIAASLIAASFVGTGQQAFAEQRARNEQSANAVQNAQAGLVAANVAVPVNANVQNVDVDVVCVISASDTCTSG